MNRYQFARHLLVSEKGVVGVILVKHHRITIECSLTKLFSGSSRGVRIYWDFIDSEVSERWWALKNQQSFREILTGLGESK